MHSFTIAIAHSVALFLKFVWIKIMKIIIPYSWKGKILTNCYGHVPLSTMCIIIQNGMFYFGE